MQVTRLPALASPFLLRRPTPVGGLTAAARPPTPGECFSVSCCFSLHDTAVSFVSSGIRVLAPNISTKPKYGKSAPTTSVGRLAVAARPPAPGECFSVGCCLSLHNTAVSIVSSDIRVFWPCTAVFRCGDGAPSLPPRSGACVGSRETEQHTRAGPRRASRAWSLLAPAHAAAAGPRARTRGGGSVGCYVPRLLP